MEESILLSTKKVLGLAPEDTSFDLDVITHINSTFSNLHDLGLGPVDGFMIEDEEAVWADVVTNIRILSQVKTYVYLKVRLVFDPPTTSYVLNAMKDQIAEHEWRLSAVREATAWVDPNPPVVMADE